MPIEDADERPDDVFDCLVVGGGPAGLTAAIYLARFHLAVLVVDAGTAVPISFPGPTIMQAFRMGLLAAPCSTE